MPNSAGGSIAFYMYESTDGVTSTQGARDE